jgi:hypothetical protein
MKKAVVFIALAAIVAACIWWPPANNAIRRLFNKAEQGVERPDGVAPTKLLGGGDTEGRVYTLRNGDYYHRHDCAELEGESPVVMDLDKAKALYKPCPVCNPDE